MTKVVYHEDGKYGNSLTISKNKGKLLVVEMVGNTTLEALETAFQQDRLYNPFRYRNLTSVTSAFKFLLCDIPWPQIIPERCTLVYTKTQHETEPDCATFSLHMRETGTKKTEHIFTYQMGLGLSARGRAFLEVIFKTAGMVATERVPEEYRLFVNSF